MADSEGSHGRREERQVLDLGKLIVDSRKNPSTPRQDPRPNAQIWTPRPQESSEESPSILEDLVQPQSGPATVQPQQNEEELTPAPQDEQPASAGTPINTGRLGTSLLTEPPVKPVTEDQGKKSPSPSDFLTPYRNQPKPLNPVTEKKDDAPLTSSIMYQDWMNLINSGTGSGAGAAEIPFSGGTPQQDVSVLGNGYVQPVTPMPQGPQTSGYFSGANQPGARGTNDSELKQAAALAAMNANTYYQDPAVLDAVAQLRQNALDQINQLVTPMPQGPQTSGYFSGANQPGARGVPDNGILFGGNGSTLPAPQVVDRNAPDYQPPSYGVFSEVVSDIINAGNSSRAADDWVNSHISENATWDTIDQIRDNLYTQYYDGIENGTIAEGTPVTPKDVTDWINNNLVVDENTQQLYDQYEAATKVADNAGLEPGSPEYYNYVNNYLDREGTPGNQRYVPQTGSTTGGTTGSTTQPTTTAPQTTGSGSSGKNFAEGLGDWISGLFGGNNTDGSNGTPRPVADAYLNSTQGGTTTPQGGSTSGTTPTTTPPATGNQTGGTTAPQTTGSQGGNTSPYDNPNRYNPDSSAYYSRKFDDLMIDNRDLGGTLNGESIRKLLATPVNVNNSFKDIIATDFAYDTRDPLSQSTDISSDQYKKELNAFLDVNPTIKSMLENKEISVQDIINTYLKNLGVPASGSGSGNGSSKPDGSKTYQPSYEQGGQVVKAPYRKGGYSEDELQKMGNKPYTDYRGYKAYEGYYYNVYDKKWYPVDQDKANYYNYYGTYNGYNDDMKQYYNTFGTYYGYRPGWRTAGRSGGGRRYGGGGGRGGGGYSGGGSGSGSTSSANNEIRVNNIMKNWSF